MGRSRNGVLHAEVCMTRLSVETQHEERCHCEFVTDSVSLQSEGEKKREGEIFPGLWDTVILIKSRRAEKESWEIKSVQHRRTHVVKHGKNNRGKGDKRWNQHHRVSTQTWTCFCPRRSCWGLGGLSLSCLSCPTQTITFSCQPAVWHFQNFWKHYKTEKKNHLCATSQKWKDG